MKSIKLKMDELEYLTTEQGKTDVLSDYMKLENGNLFSDLCLSQSNQIK